MSEDSGVFCNGRRVADNVVGDILISVYDDGTTTALNFISNEGTVLHMEPVSRIFLPFLCASAK